MESRAGVDESEKISRLEVVKRCVERETEEAECVARERVRAPRFPALLIASLEMAVCDGGVAVCLRVAAWARLLKIYGAMRADDLQRLSPKRISLTEGGFNGHLQRTKTSGAGKKVRDLFAFIPMSAWIVNSEWLREG